MRYTKSIAGSALMGAALVFGAVTANAEQVNSEPPSSRTCIQAGRDVRAALESNASSPNYSAAMASRRQGLLACNSGFYKMGMAHYQVALKLLEAPKS